MAHAGSPHRHQAAHPILRQPVASRSAWRWRQSPVTPQLCRMSPVPARHRSHPTRLLPSRIGPVWARAAGPWLRTSLLAALLIALAPALSWTLQGLRAGQPHLQHASHAGHTAAPPAPVQAAMQEHGHGQRHHAAAAGEAAARPVAPSDLHSGHGAACDYCVIAARALAMAAIVLLALWLPAHTPPASTPRSAPLPPARWPAHPARGPPSST